MYAIVDDHDRVWDGTTFSDSTESAKLFFSPTHARRAIHENGLSIEYLRILGTEYIYGTLLLDHHRNSQALANRH